MNYLVIGLGSMGKRRVRNLLALDVPANAIVGFDVKSERAQEAAEAYGITTYNSWEDAIKSRAFHACIISVPPDLHHIYMKEALKHNIHYFIEASVVDTNLDEIIAMHAESGLVAAPSGTLYFHPAIKKIYELVNGNYLGKVSSVVYHSGQYLPDWHTYEPVSAYYVSNPATGGAREIVPFELTWITKLFGLPESTVGIKKKTIHIAGAEEIDDTYAILLDYSDFIINMHVDVVSRYATRKLTISGSERMLTWNWEKQAVDVYDPKTEAWESFTYDALPANDKYNANITEQMYIDEVRNFIEATEGKQPFFNSLEYDRKVLNILYAAENSLAVS